MKSTVQTDFPTILVFLLNEERATKTIVHPMRTAAPICPCRTFERVVAQAVCATFIFLLLALCIPHSPSRFSLFSAISGQRPQSGTTYSPTDTTGGGDGSGKTAAGSPEGETSGSERVNVKLEKLNGVTLADTAYDSREKGVRRN